MEQVPKLKSREDDEKAKQMDEIGEEDDVSDKVLLRTAVRPRIPILIGQITMSTVPV